MYSINLYLYRLPNGEIRKPIIPPLPPGRVGQAEAASARLPPSRDPRWLHIWCSLNDLHRKIASRSLPSNFFYRLGMPVWLWQAIGLHHADCNLTQFLLASSSWNKTIGDEQMLELQVFEINSVLRSVRMPLCWGLKSEFSMLQRVKELVQWHDDNIRIATILTVEFF